jgi:hypothetical protein
MEVKISLAAPITVAIYRSLRPRTVTDNRFCLISFLLSRCIARRHYISKGACKEKLFIKADVMLSWFLGPS